MTSKTMIHLAALGMLAASIAVPHAASASPHAASPWHRYELPVQGRATIMSIAATGQNDAWAAGFTVNDTGPAADECWSGASLPSLMLRWDGDAWRRAPVPNLGRINVVSASGPDDAWASADCGLLRWDGRCWTPAQTASVPGAQQVAPGRVKAVGPKQAWLVGGTYDSETGAERGIVQRWDGRQWRLVPLPSLGDAFSLDAIDVRSPHDVWAVGTDFADGTTPERLLLLHWNGRTWKRAAEPDSSQWTKRLTSVRILGAGDVWVTGWSKAEPDGDAIRRPLLLHWNGRAWTSTPAPAGRGGIVDLARDGQQPVAVGDTFTPSEPSYGMYALRWNGSRWADDAVPAAGTGSLSTVAAIPGGGTWAGGVTGDEDTMTPLIARRD